jgi:hypothetical protein
VRHEVRRLIRTIFRARTVLLGIILIRRLMLIQLRKEAERCATTAAAGTT